MIFEKRIIRTSPVVGCSCALVIAGCGSTFRSVKKTRILKDPLAICSWPKGLIAQTQTINGKI